MDIHQAVFDDRQGEKEADQQGIEARHEEEGVAKLHQVIGDMEEEADEEHGDDPPQEV